MAEPKVRFKRDDDSSYPAWNDVILGDISTRVTRKKTNGETDRPLTIASIEGLVDQRSYFGKTIASKDMSGYFLLKNGEYAYNKSYSAGYDYGSIKRLDKYDMGALSTLYICFALNENQNSDFYNCYFNGLSWYNQMPQICAEGARNHGLLNVSPNDFFKIRLSVPSNKEEQQKISDFLSSIDEIISASEEEVANLEKQKKAVMKKIFSQEVRFKRAAGSDFPKWDEYRIGDICKTYSGGTPKAGNDNYYGGSIPFIRSGEIHSDSTGLFLSEAGMKNSSAKMVAAGDIIMALYGATSGEVDISKIEGAINQAILCIKPDKGFDKKFVVEVIRNYKNDILKTYLQGGQGNLSAQIVQALSFYFPCLEEQHLIANFLSDFDEAIAATKKEMELWKELKKGLLQQMFV